MRGTVLIQAMLIAAIVLVFMAFMGTIAYRITAEALEVLILGRVVRRIRLDDIEEVHRRGALLHENWSGPRFWNAVIIRRRTGLLKNFLISPPDPDRFAERLAASARCRGPAD
jgi:hypothetical protein